MTLFNNIRRNSFITQTKPMIFWWNKKFVKVDIFLFQQKKCWTWFWAGPVFCPNRVLIESFKKIFFHSYSIRSYWHNWISWHILSKISKESKLSGIWGIKFGPGSVSQYQKQKQKKTFSLGFLIFCMKNAIKMIKK